MSRCAGREAHSARSRARMLVADRLCPIWRVLAIIARTRAQHRAVQLRLLGTPTDGKSFARVPATRAATNAGGIRKIMGVLSSATRIGRAADPQAGRCV